MMRYLIFLIRESMHRIKPVHQGDLRKLVSLAPRDTDKQTPTFSFEHTGKSHGLGNCNKDEKAALVEQLHALSKLSWEQIKQSGRHGLGFEKIERAAISEPIPSIVTPDVCLVAFRFCGKKPMVGFRSGRVFNIIWLDRDFKLYKH